MLIDSPHNGCLDKHPEPSTKPSRDQVLDAFDVLHRAGARPNLRSLLDAVYEAGYVEGIAQGKAIAEKSHKETIYRGQVQQLIGHGGGGSR